MRKGLAVLAAFLGIVSILLTARYGWKQADEEIDQWIGAIVYGSISLCAFVFDAVAVKLWFKGLHKAALFIAIIAGAAFVVTFSNSLGGIVSRADTVVAGRQAVVDDREDNRAELKRLQDLLRGLKYAPTDEAAVAAAQLAATTAASQRKTECGESNEKRGPLCKIKETAETDALTKLAGATTNKATTDTAKGYETKIDAIKRALNDGRRKNVGAPNSWAKAATELLGEWAAGLATWQQAAIAFVFDLCIVGVMVSFAMLGEVVAPPARPKDTTEGTARVILPVEEPKPAKPRLVAQAEPYKADVHRIMRDALTAAKGERAELGQCLLRYQAEGGAQCTPNEFMLVMVVFCNASKIRTKEIGGKVYLMDVRLAVSQPAADSSSERPGSQRLGRMGHEKRE